MLVRRLVFIFAIVLAGSLAAAAGAVAAGGLGPGKYTFHSSSADAFFGMAKKGGPPAASWQVSVSQGLNSFKPAGGSRVVLDSTMVFVTEFDATGQGGFGCFIVPDSSFAVSRDLQSASLHATLTQAEACPGYSTPVAGPKDVAFAGGNDGLNLPLQVDVTWSASGAVTAYQQSFTLQCLNYKEDGNSNNLSTGASAAGTISALNGSFNSDSADLTSTVGKLNVNGVPPSGCFGY
jgi:hypothetical protein